MREQAKGSILNLGAYKCLAEIDWGRHVEGATGVPIKRAPWQNRVSP